jgi:copper resistance protein C
MWFSCRLNQLSKIKGCNSQEMTKTLQCSIAQAAILLILFLPSARAHAILVAAAPSAGQVVQGPDVPIRLRFNSRIDWKRSRVVLFAPDGKPVPLASEAEPSPDTLSSRARGLKPGVYLIRWQVLAKDGHITRGEVGFRVH